MLYVYTVYTSFSSFCMFVHKTSIQKKYRARVASKKALAQTRERERFWERIAYKNQHQKRFCNVNENAQKNSMKRREKNHRKINWKKRQSLNININFFKWKQIYWEKYTHTLKFGERKKEPTRLKKYEIKKKRPKTIESIESDDWRCEKRSNEVMDPTKSLLFQPNHLVESLLL